MPFDKINQNKNNQVARCLQIFSFGFFVLCILVSVVFIYMHRYPFAMATIAAPAVILTISYPRLIPYLFVLTTTIFWAPIPGTGFFLADFTALLFLGAVMIDYLVRGRTGLLSPGIGRNYLLLLAALVITGVFAMNPQHAVGPILRAAIQLSIIILLYNTIRLEDINRLIRFYFWIMVLHSVFNVLVFLNLGGAYRIFGFAFVYYDDLAMLAAPIGVCYYLWSESRKRSLLYGLAVLIVILGIISTHSRLPLMTTVMVSTILAVVSLFKSGANGSVIIRRRLILMGIAILSVSSVLVVYLDIFQFAFERFGNLVTDTYTGTVATRLSLWNAGIKAFVNNPLTGIGPGNFRFIDLAFPELKFDAARIWVRGYSAHNLVIHYLAETGLIGTAAILSVYFNNLKSAWKVLRRSHSALPDSLRWSLFGVGLTIAITVFYMDGWMWGLVACAAPFFFAITSKALSGDNDHE